MEKNFNTDLSGVIAALNVFQKVEMKNADSFLREQTQAVFAIHRFLFELKKETCLMTIINEREIISYLHKLIPQVTQLQEMLLQFNYESAHMNRLDFTLDDILDLIIEILKAIKGKQSNKPEKLFAKAV